MLVTYYTYHILHSILLKIPILENTKFLTEKFPEFLNLTLNKIMPIPNP